MIDMFWNLWQERRLTESKASNQVVKENLADAREQIGLLQEHVDKLTIACMAMWSLLEEKRGMTNEEFLSRVTSSAPQRGAAS